MGHVGSAWVRCGGIYLLTRRVIFRGVEPLFPGNPQCHSEECISVSSIDVLIIYGGFSIPKGFNHVRMVEEPRGTETLC